MEIFVIYISAFSSFISSAEGKRRSRTQAKRKQHARKAQKFQIQHARKAQKFQKQHALKGQKFQKQHARKAQKLQKQHARKVQKLQKQHALKGQKLLAQGIALGIMAISKTPCKGKSFQIPGQYTKLLPLQHQSSLIPEHEFFIIFHII